jgi:peptide/nickel transport system substrate-binding protein
MTRLLRAGSPLLCTVVAAVAAATLVACQGSANNASSGGAKATAGASSGMSGGTLTIQGDSGNPTLVENFNPLASTELHGTFLIYEPLEIPSPIDGTYTPFLATGYKFTNPTTLVYTIRQGVKWSDGTAFTPADVVFTFNLLKKFPADQRSGRLGQ